MNDYDGPATINVGDVHADVLASVLVTPSADAQLGAWRGVFTVVHGYLDPGDGEIELEDGRRGKIVVTNVNLAPMTDCARGSFLGSGAPPA
jgi:hypothetical protein